MEESDLDLLFLSILLLLTVVLSISLRLHALHIPNKGFKKRLDITPLPKEVAKGDIIIRSPPSASTSPGAASGEEENVVGWTRVDSYPNPRFPEPHELPKKSRATVVEVVAMRMCSASEVISKRQIIRDSQEKLISAKLSVDLCATSDLRRFPELPANLCSGFFEGLFFFARSTHNHKIYCTAQVCSMHFGFRPSIGCRMRASIRKASMESGKSSASSAKMDGSGCLWKFVHP